MGKGAHRDEKGLSLLDRRFASEYLIDLSATDAYMRAALPRKVSKKTAGTNGWKVLQRPEVQQLVREFRDAAIARSDLSTDNTLEKLRQLLHYDVRKLYDENGTPKKITELDDDMAAAIVGIKVVTKGNAEMGFGDVTEFKLADKVAALEKAMRYFALFEKDNRQRTDPVAELIAAIYQKGSRLEPKP